MTSSWRILESSGLQLLNWTGVRASHIATDGQSVNKSWCWAPFGLITKYLLPFDSYGFVFVGHPLWREDGSVFFICSSYLPVQCFSGPISLGLVTIFYCLRNCWCYSVSQSQSNIATDGQSASKSWCQAPSGAHEQIFITVWQLWFIL
jgi:hypothetical protein